MRIFTVSAIMALSIVVVNAAEADYTQGVFIVNEDWYGHHNSTVNHFNHLDPDGDIWHYRVIQAENPGVELGCTNQFGQIYGDRFYLIAKQDKDGGASITGGRITVADAKTLKVLYQSRVIDPSGKQCDGRGFLGVDEHKGYISASNGVWVFDLDTYTVVKQVDGSENPDMEDTPGTSPSGSLYHGQCGTMVRVNNRVFAAHQSSGLLVINPFTDKVEKTIPIEIEGQDAPGIGSVVLSKDGFLWLSVAKDIQGTGATLPYLVKVNPSTLATEYIPISDEYNAPANSWYAWTPDGFCASARENALFWNGGANSWFSQSKIFRYDIDSGKFSCIIDFDAEPLEDGQAKPWSLYGCSMRVHPVTDEIYLSVFPKQSFTIANYRLRRYSTDGELLGQYPMITDYWFPSIPVFPDNEYPVVKSLPVIDVAADVPTTISLSGWATDDDNMTAAIVNNVKSVSDPSFSAEVVDGDLVVTPVDNPAGIQNVEIEVNSNGHVIYAPISISFTNSGVDEVVSIEKSAWAASDGIHSTFPAKVYDTCGRYIGCVDAESPLCVPAGIYIVSGSGVSLKIILCR